MKILFFVYIRVAPKNCFRLFLGGGAVLGTRMYVGWGTACLPWMKGGGGDLFSSIFKLAFFLQFVKVQYFWLNGYLVLLNYPTKKKPSWNPNLFHSSVQLTKNGWWKREIEETTRPKWSVGRSYFQWHGTWVFWPLMRSAVRKSWWSLGHPKERRRWATTKTKRRKDERGRWLVFLGDV